MGTLSDFHSQNKKWTSALWKGIKEDPWRLLVGVDPVSTAISNAILGRDDEALGGYLGGPSSKQKRELDLDAGERKAAGYGQTLAGILGAIFGGAALFGGGGGAGGGAGGAQSGFGGGPIGQSGSAAQGGFGAGTGGGAPAGGVPSTSGGLPEWNRWIPKQMPGGGQQQGSKADELLRMLIEIQMQQKIRNQERLLQSTNPYDRY